MLLGSTAKKNTTSGTESLIIQLMLQHRYAEAYELLINQQPASTAGRYNLAICLHWSGNFQAALIKLESIQLGPHVSNSNQPNMNGDYKEIKSKQNKSDDHLHGISESYIESFPALFHDAIIRLKTDCWLQLGNYAKVVAIATPMVQKGYKNITDALKIAETGNDKRI